ncbi:four helix bundle protein [Candidatus Peregrinibacteria bacterium]|nr:four helix bundle protein [Candidatus Peregrinibacteria bacterium]
MQKPNVIQEKSYGFSLHIIEFCNVLNERRQYVLSKQLLKSGTSIGANIEEALQAQSRRDFIAKLSISLKEAFETKYWLRLIRDSKTASLQEMGALFSEIDEILKLLISIIKTSKAT